MDATSAETGEHPKILIDHKTVSSKNTGAKERVLSHEIEMSIRRREMVHRNRVGSIKNVTAGYNFFLIENVSYYLNSDYLSDSSVTYRDT